jgi:hypothetical protein
MSNSESIIPEDCSTVACGTLRQELRALADEGFIDKEQLFFAAPGLHEWPEILRGQLTKRLERVRSDTGRLLVVYGEKCYFDFEAGVDTDVLLEEFAPGAVRIEAKNCVDMLVDEEEREQLAGGDRIHWLTPGWLEHWDFIFKDWDAAKANETFPANDRAILLDSVGYYDTIAEKDPEKLLRICDWMRLEIVPQPTSLERLKALLLNAARRMGPDT